MSNVLPTQETPNAMTPTATMSKEARTQADFLAANPIDEVRKVQPAMKRAALAEKVRATAEELCKDIRWRRNLAAYTLAFPWIEITNEYAPREAELKSVIETYSPRAGGAVPPEYLAALDELDTLREQKNARLREVTRPSDMYRTLGISKNLWVRTLSDAPSVNPKVPNARRAMEQARDEFVECDRVLKDARAVRDEALAELFADPTVLNADIARATELTPQRITQLRTAWQREASSPKAKARRA